MQRNLSACKQHPTSTRTRLVASLSDAQRSDHFSSVVELSSVHVRCQKDTSIRLGGKLCAIVASYPHLEISLQLLVPDHGQHGLLLIRVRQQVLHQG